MDINTDMALSSGTDQDLTVASGDIQATHVWPFLSTLMSLHSPQTVPLLTLSHLSTPYLHIVVARAADHEVGGVSGFLQMFVQH